MKALQHLRFHGSKAGVAVAVGALVLGGGLGGVGYAAVTSGPVHTCVAAHTGALRVAGKCTKTEKALVLGARGHRQDRQDRRAGRPRRSGRPGRARRQRHGQGVRHGDRRRQGNPTLTGAVGFTDMTKPGGVNSNVYCLYVAAGIPRPSR